jgi:hypothetical protein
VSRNATDYGISVSASAVREGLIVELLGGVPKSNLKTIPPFPAQAVVAFDRPGGCPEGWVPLQEAQGRTIVGVGVLSVDEDRKTEYRYRHDGGEHEVTLSESHLPRHQHAYVDVYYTERRDFQPPGISSVDVPRAYGSEGGRDSDNVGWVRPSTVTDFSGLEDQETFTNMQPYIVLHYCKLE